MDNTVSKLGNELKVGDLIEVWWCREDRGQKRTPKGIPLDEITALVPYQGPLNRTCFNRGARIATFRYCRVGMTIPNDEVYFVQQT